MNIYSLPPLIAVLLTICFLFLLKKHSQNKDIKQLGVVYSLLIIWWQLGYAVLFSVKDVILAGIISKLIYSGVIFLPPAWSHFFFFICTGKRSRFIQICFYLSAFFLPFIWTSDLFVKGIHSYYFGFYTKGGILHIVHIMMTVTISCYVIGTTIKYLYSPRREQARNVLVGFIISVFSVSDYIIKHGVEFYPFGWMFVSASFGYIMYKITFGSFADLSILANKLKIEIEKEKAKSLYLVKVFAHDIKNRLVSGMISLQFAQKKEGHNKYIAQSLHDQKHMNRMVGNLINVFLDDQIVLNKKTVEIEDLTEGFEKEWSLKFEDKNIPFIIEKDAVESIDIDPAYMELVWENLFANALQHTPRNGIFKLHIRKNHNHITFAFSNSGKTIPEEYRGTIFKKYLSPDQHTAYNKGLGLNYSKMMAERHKGKLEYAISDEGLNTFTVSLLV